MIEERIACLKVGSYWQKRRGKIYVVVGFAIDTASSQVTVLYRRHDDTKVCTRNLADFLSEEVYEETDAGRTYGPKFNAIDAPRHAHLVSDKKPLRERSTLFDEPKKVIDFVENFRSYTKALKTIAQEARISGENSSSHRQAQIKLERAQTLATVLLELDCMLAQLEEDSHKGEA